MIKHDAKAEVDMDDEMDAEHPEHEVKDAADTLMRAEEIKGHKTLHAAAMKHLGKKKGHIAKLEGVEPKITSIKGLIKKGNSLKD